MSLKSRHMLIHRNRLITYTVVLIILAIIFAAAPEKYHIVAEGSYSLITVQEIIRFVVAIFILIFVLLARSSLIVVTSYYGEEVFKTRIPNRSAAIPHIHILSQESSTLIAAGILWPVVLFMLRFLLWVLDIAHDFSPSTAEQLIDWHGYIPMIIFIPVIIVCLIKGITALRNVLDITSGVAGYEQVERASSLSTGFEPRQKIQPEPTTAETFSCDKCGAKNISSAKFCASCGNKLILKEKSACPNCGMVNLPSAKFCASCGKSLEQLPKEPGKLICSSCNTENKLGAKFCFHCGTQLTQ